MFITVACGAISGFHSHAVAVDGALHEGREAGSLRILRRNGSRGHHRAYLGGAGCALYEVTGGLNTGLAEVLAGGQSAAIYDVCSKTMGGRWASRSR